MRSISILSALISILLVRSSPTASDAVPAQDRFPEFQKACEEGDTNLVQLLISDGVDPSASNNWAIKAASFHGHSEVVKLLLNDSRVDVYDHDPYPFAEMILDIQFRYLILVMVVNICRTTFLVRLVGRVCVVT